MTREDKLRRCAEGVPVLGADAALAHTLRGYGAPAPEALEAVHAALDAWDANRVRVNDMVPGVRTPYSDVVTTLTHYHYAVRRALGMTAGRFG